MSNVNNAANPPGTDGPITTYSTTPSSSRSGVASAKTNSQRANLSFFFHQNKDEINRQFRSYKPAEPLMFKTVSY